MMTDKEEMALRELAAGRCVIQKVINAVGPMSLWSKDGLEREIRKAYEEGFYAGFEASGEGWNGEYPFSDKGIDIRKDPSVQHSLNESRGEA